MTISFGEMEHIVDQIQVREGWHLKILPATPNEELDRGNCRLEISTDLVLNTRYEPSTAGFVGQYPKHVQLFMPRYSPRAAEETPARFRDWVIYEYLWLRLHEELEWIKYPDGSPIIDPHNGEATVTKLLPPRPGESWWKREA